MSPPKALLKLTHYEKDASETEFPLFAQRLFSTVFATALCGCYGVKELHFIEKNGVLCTYCCSLACLLDDSICSPKMLTSQNLLYNVCSLLFTINASTETLESFTSSLFSKAYALLNITYSEEIKTYEHRAVF